MKTIMTDKKINNEVKLPNFRQKDELRETTKTPMEGEAKVEKTSDFYRTDNLPMRFEYPVCFQGYGNPKQQNPMYRTTSAEYGGMSPTVHTVPVSFHPRCRKFTNHLGLCGMYRNRSLNTSLDKSII